LPKACQMILSCDKTLTVANPSAYLFGRPYLWIQTAAGPRIGFGHLKRCMILAQSLHDCSTPLFFLDPQDRWCREQLTAQGYEFCCEGLEKAWSLFSDPSAILIDTRLIDGLGLFISGAQNRGIPVISIHDLGLNPLPSDIVIDGSIAPGSFQNIFSRKAEIFRGTDYMILDPVLQQLHQKRRRIRKKIQSIIVNLGGGNSQAFFPKILEGVKLWDREVTVVGIRGFIRWGQDRLERMDWRPIHFRWESASPYPFLMNADLAITAGGLSAYEALCIGTPLLALSYDPLQQITIHAMAGAGACVDLGPGEDLNPMQLAETLARLDADREGRARISLNGKKEVDGCGAERVSCIVRESIHRRAAARQENIE
jgi:spore coat polysaccharide biosynthesis predicted glycosyltransferase SpsG